MSVLVEPCAGSAAVARQLCRLGRVVGYMGGKDGYAEAIVAAWRPPEPTRVVLNDPGLWGLIWEGVVQARLEVAEAIRVLARDDALETFERAVAVRADYEATPLNAALALCRIAGSYCGSETGGFKGDHKLRPNAEGFTPGRLALAERVAAMDWPVPVTVSRAPASALRIPAGSWVYIDPPYSGTKGYLFGLDRREVLALARHCVGVARSVAVSEGERLVGLSDWRHVRLTDSRYGQSRKHSRSHEEHLTISRRPVGVRW